MDWTPKIPIFRMLGLGLLSALTSAVAGYFVCLRTHSVVAMMLAMLAVFVITGYFSARWFVRTVGGPGEASVHRPLPGAVRRAIIAGLVMLGGFGAAAGSYAVTGNRLLEGVLGLVMAIPFGFSFIRKSYALCPPAQLREVPLLRINFYVQLSLPITFGLTLFFQLTQRHHYADVAFLRESFVAMAVVLIPLFPISAYYLRQRYLQAAGPSPGRLTAAS